MPRVITYHTYLTGMNTLLTLSLFERPLHATPHAMNYATAAPATAGGQQNGPVSKISLDVSRDTFAFPAELYLLSTIDKGHQQSMQIIVANV